MAVLGPSEVGWGQFVTWAVVTVWAVGVAWRAAKQAIVVRPDAFVVRGVFGTRRLPWTSIGTIEARRVYPMGVIPWWALVVTDAAGSRHELSAVSVCGLRREPTMLHEVADQLMRVARRSRGSQRTAG